MSDVDALARSIKSEYEGCFGCGERNPMGLRLSGFETGDSSITASFRPLPDHRGFEGVLHGGIVAAALDEVMAWTAMLLESVMVVTGKIEVRYRSPAPTSAPYAMEGILEERRGRRLTMRARATAEDKLIAEASGLFLVAHEIDFSNP